MKKAEFERWFQENFIDGTCFHSIGEVKADNSNIETNAPRALTAVNLHGAYVASKELNNYIGSLK